MMDFPQKDADLGGIAPPSDITPQPDPDLPPPETGLDAPPDMDAGFSDVVSAGWTAETIRTDAWDYTATKRRALADQMFDSLPADRKSRVWQKFADNSTGWTTFEELVVNEAAELAKSPEAAADWAGFPLSKQAMEQRILEERRRELDAAQRILDQDGGGFAEFIGSSARAMTDQASLLMLPLGGGSGSAVRIIASEAALGALGEAAVLPREFQVAQELDLPDPDPMARILTGAALGGGLSAAVLGIAKGVSHWRARRAGVDAARPAEVDPLDFEARVDDAEDELTGTATVQQRIGGKIPPDAGTLPAILDASPAGTLPRISADAPAGWAEIRNGIFAGESGGDYNALFGFQNRRGGAFSRVRLTEMTVDQALAFAAPNGQYAQWVKSKIGRIATPMGAYQIVGKTLRAAKHGLGLRGDELMTADLQERLAHWIYRQQGTGAWEGYKGPRKSFVPVGAEADAPRLGPTSRGYTGTNQMRVSDNMRIDVSYEVVDASTLRRASGDLQPRDRTGINSDIWIAEQAARLDPAQLGRSPNASTGAPIVGPDNMIESGNGRFGIIARAYERHPDRAAAYRNFIEAEGYTIPEGVKQPVLIARRTSELDHAGRVRLVNDAQDSGVAVLRPVEMAQANARNLSDRRMALFRGDLDIAAPENRDFVRGWLESLSAATRSAVTDGDNALNSYGRRMVREAVFARAWPNADLIEMMTEGAAGEMKSLMDALVRAAPDWAMLRADIAAGHVAPEFDLTGNVLDAMQLIVAARQTARREGQTIAAAMADLLDSPDLLDGAISPVTRALLGKFWRKGRTAPEDEIAGFLSRYAAEARRASDAAGGFLDAPSPVDVLRALDRSAFGDLPDDVAAALGQPAPARDPEPLPDAGFDQGADSPEAVAIDNGVRDDMARALAQEPAQTPTPARDDALAQLRAEFDGLTLDLGETQLSARDLLDELDADDATEAVIQACGIIPKGTAQ